MIIKFLGTPLRITLSSFFMFYVLGDWGYRLTGTILGGAVFSLLGVLSILLHEKGHIFAAERFGIRCAGISLIVFGGLAHLESLGRKARELFTIAIAGPLVTLILIFAGTFLANLFPKTSDTAKLLGGVVFLNTMMLIFNLLPIYPLDGGRVLHSILWGISKDGDRARLRSVTTGRVCIVAGLSFLAVLVFAGRFNMFSFMWLAFVAFMLWSGGGMEVNNAQKKQ